MTAKKYAIQCIKDEAEAVMGLIPQIDDSFEEAVELIYGCKGKIIVTGVGKSGHIGAKIAATLSSTGTPSFFINPLDVFHGDLGVMAHGDVVLADTYHRHERKSEIAVGKIQHMSLECQCGKRGLSTEPGAHQFNDGTACHG